MRDKVVCMPGPDNIFRSAMAQHFPFHFYERKILCFDSHFTESCFCMLNWHYIPWFRSGLARSSYLNHWWHGGDWRFHISKGEISPLDVIRNRLYLCNVFRVSHEILWVFNHKLHILASPEGSRRFQEWNHVSLASGRTQQPNYFLSHGISCLEYAPDKSIIFVPYCLRLTVYNSVSYSKFPMHVCLRQCILMIFSVDKWCSSICFYSFWVSVSWYTCTRCAYLYINLGALKSDTCGHPEWTSVILFYKTSLQR